jgi:lipoteichoic acid synthase
MLKKLIKNQLKPAIIIFLILNTLKITLFNFFIIPNQTFLTFTYKFEVSILFATIFYLLIFTIKSRIPFIILYLVQTVYIVVNISYYMYFHSYLHILQCFTLFNEALIAAGHSAAPKSIKLMITIIDLPFFLYIIFYYAKVISINSKLRIQKISLIASSLLIILCIEVSNYIHDYSIIQYVNDMKRGESPIVERYGTLANNIVNIYLNKSDKELISKLKYGEEQKNTIVSVKKPNFVIIQVESMDSNVVNQRYKGQYIAPFLHSLAVSGIYYPYTLSYHLGGATSDCEFSIINSVEPLTDYPAIKLANYDYSNSMIKSLSAASYKAVTFHGNVGDYYNRDVAFPKMGFNNFLDIDNMQLKNVGWGAPDSDVFKYCKNYLKDIKQPFLSYIITISSHGPFTNAKLYYNNNLYDDIKDTLVKNYFNSMSYADESIKNFVSNIEASYKNTYIFIWGDHTPNISTDLYKQASFTIDNKYFEFVPLIIITPDKKVYNENKSVASFLDISPTILSQSGIKYEIKSNGVNLINFTGNSPIPFKGSDYDRKYLYNKIIKSSNP